MIYAIFYLPKGKVYVGQTINSVWHRFQQHLSQRHLPSKEVRIKKVLQLAGKEWWKDFALLPLEVIHQVNFHRTNDRPVSKNVKDQELHEFRLHSFRREGFWINKLRSNGRRGLNVKF